MELCIAPHAKMSPGVNYPLAKYMVPEFQSAMVFLYLLAVTSGVGLFRKLETYLRVESVEAVY